MSYFKASLILCITITTLLSYKEDNITSGNHCDKSYLKMGFNNSANTIYKEVPAEEIRQALKQSKDKKVVISAYPVKKTNSQHSNDVDLKIFFQDNAGHLLNINNQVNQQKFKAETQNVIYLLKNKKISNNDGNIYYIKLDSSKLNNIDAIAFYYSVTHKHMEYYFLSNNKEHSEHNTLDSSSGKCPPCYMHYKFAAPPSPNDTSSTGKCPPSCHYYLSSTH